MIVKLIFFIIMSALIALPPSFANGLVALKYNYGRREAVNSQFLPGEVILADDLEYPWGFTYSRIPTSPVENINIKKQHSISMNLSVKKVKGNILATVKILNNGNKSYYIRGLSLPMNYTNDDSTKASVLCWSSFQITSGNIYLYYLGATCNSGSSFEKREWLEIKPHKMLSFTVKLNDSYEFLTGKRHYEIITSNYSLVDDNWFVRRSINEMFFPILTMEIVKNCADYQEKIYVYKREETCNPNLPYPKIMSLLYHAGIYPISHDSDNELSIRSEPVTIEIDGSKIRSLYTRPPYNGSR